MYLWLKQPGKLEENHLPAWFIVPLWLSQSSTGQQPSNQVCVNWRKRVLAHNLMTGWWFSPVHLIFAAALTCFPRALEGCSDDVLVDNKRQWRKKSLRVQAFNIMNPFLVALLHFCWRLIHLPIEKSQLDPPDLLLEESTTTSQWWFLLTLLHKISMLFLFSTALLKVKRIILFVSLDWGMVGGLASFGQSP